MSDHRSAILGAIAQAILAAARERGETVQDWYLSDADYEEFVRASEALCGHPTMKICGATIHRAPNVKNLVAVNTAKKSP